VAAPPQGRHGEVIYHFPLWPTLGPGSDAWTDYGERDGGRHFLSSNPKYGEWEGFTFFSNGSKPISPRGNEVSFVRSAYIEVTKQKEGKDNGHKINLMVHIAVALLFGAPKRTAHPMSELLVVDHIVEGNKKDYRLDNLQILSGLQNTDKATNEAEIRKDNSVMPLPPGDAAGNGWYGESVPLYEFTLSPTLGPGNDAWIRYGVRTLSGRFRGKVGRHFLATDPKYGVWASFTFFKDGSKPISPRGNEVSWLRNGYPTISKRGDGYRLRVHVAVAYLFGAPKITDYPMSLLLVVDHVVEGDKTNFRLDNLQIATQLQNSQKGNGVDEKL